jgi:hypothetical protein
MEGVAWAAGAAIVILSGMAIVYFLNRLTAKD